MVTTNQLKNKILNLLWKIYESMVMIKDQQEKKQKLRAAKIVYKDGIKPGETQHHNTKTEP